MEYKNMEKWSFGMNNDYLVSLVLANKKMATTSNYNPKKLPVIGNKSIIMYDNGKDACIVETVDFKILKFKEITPELSDLEGEGPYEKWRENHLNFFKGYDKNFNKEKLVVFEIFKLIEKI